MHISAELGANSSDWKRCRCFFLSFWNENHRESFTGSQPLMRRLWCLSRVHIINTPSVPSLIRIQLRHLHRGDAGVELRLKFTSAKMFFCNWTSSLLLLFWNECSKTTIRLRFTAARKRKKELAYFQVWISSSSSHCNGGALKAKYLFEMTRY